MNNIIFDDITKYQIEYLDHETLQHSQNVSEMVEFIAITMNYSESIPNLKKISLFHDIGKTKLPIELLVKPGPLTAEEWKIVKTHTIIGVEILRDLGYTKECLLAVEQHHEKIGGNGYPYGLSGDAIALSAHIISVCDVIDALLSDRSYKKAWSIEKIRGFFHKNLEGFYQPVVDVALEHFDELIALRQYV